MPLLLKNKTLSLRPVTAADDELLCAIYASTRTAEMERVDWPAEHKEAFLRMQFSAQHVWYQDNYKGAWFWVIEYNGEAIGRLYLHPDFDADSMRIVDIALLPAWRRKGLGEEILCDVLAYAEGKNKAVTIHVEVFNPAMTLYKRLGFALVSKTNEVYHLLRWSQTQNVFA